MSSRQRSRRSRGQPRKEAEGAAAAATAAPPVDVGDGLQGDVGGPQPVLNGLAPLAAGDGKDLNDDLCKACGQCGELLCCETCPAAFHFFCAEPPLNPDQLPNIWQCNTCVQREDIMGLAATAAAPFKQMMESIAKTAPAVYRPPAHLLPTAKPKPTREKRGRKACFVCQRSTAKSPSVGCSLCPLQFHMDCLELPLPHLASGSWVCPNHPEHYLPNFRQNRRFAQRQGSWHPKSKPPTNDGDGPADLFKLKLQFIEKVRKQREEERFQQQQSAEPSPEEQQDFLDSLVSFQQQWWQSYRASTSYSDPSQPTDQATLLRAMESDISSMDASEQANTIRVLRKALAERLRDEGVATRFSGLDAFQPKWAPLAREKLVVLPSDQAKAVLRCTESGEIWEITAASFNIGATIEQDLNLTTVNPTPPFTPAAKQARICHNPSTDEFEVVNFSDEVPLYVNGVEVSVGDQRSTRLRHNDILDIAGLKFVFQVAVSLAAAQEQNGHGH